MSWNNNNLNMNNHYRNVMSKYERGENKVSLEDRGFKYSYGDECEIKTTNKEKLIMCKWVNTKKKKKRRI